MEPNERYSDVPHVGLSLQDIQTTSTIATSYLLYLHKGVLPSKKRDAEIVLLTSIQRRMRATVPTEGGMVPLTAQEIQALANALQGFARLTRQIAPPSAERDEVLAPLRAIRGHLLGMLTGKSYSNEKKKT